MTTHTLFDPLHYLLFCTIHQMKANANVVPKCMLLNEPQAVFELVGESGGASKRTLHAGDFGKAVS